MIEEAQLVIDEASGPSRRRSALISFPDGEEHVLEFKSYDGILSDDSGDDAFLLGSLLLLMAKGWPVRIQGRITARCLRNVHELQEVWARWRPERYMRVTITATETYQVPSVASQQALLAFSGGVDACYTAMRKTKKLQPNLPSWEAALGAALFVHGFDVPLSKEAVFQSARDRGRRILEATEIETLSISTNLRDLGQDWEECHGLAIAACLALFQDRFSVGYIGSGKPYEAIRLGWGSSPITDPLFSTGVMDVVHEGAGASRTEKTRALAAWEPAIRGLRICWKGDQQDRNCGKCEKCVRTYFCLRAAGVENPLCFDSTPLSSDLRRITVAKKNLLWELEDIRKQAIHIGSKDSWFDDLNFVIRKSKLLGPVLRSETYLRTRGILGQSQILRRLLKK